MPLYIVIEPLKHDGQSYAPGETVEMDAKAAREVLKLGVLALAPKAAAQTAAQAKAEAEKAKADAKAGAKAEESGKASGEGSGDGEPAAEGSTPSSEEEGK